MIQCSWLLQRSRAETPYRESLEYANQGCFYRHIHYSHLLRPLMQRGSVDV